MIRSAGEADADALFALATDFATSFAPTRPSFDRSLDRLLHDPAACLLLDDRRGYLLGGVHDTFWADGPVGWVEELMVAPDARRGGVGRDLVRAFEWWSGQRGARVVALATRRAEEFYLALGYEPSATYLRRSL